MITRKCMGYPYEVSGWVYDRGTERNTLRDTAVFWEHGFRKWSKVCMCVTGIHSCDSRRDIAHILSKFGTIIGFHMSLNYNSWDRGWVNCAYVQYAYARGADRARCECAERISADNRVGHHTIRLGYSFREFDIEYMLTHPREMITMSPRIVLDGNIVDLLRDTNHWGVSPDNAHMFGLD